MASNYGMEIEGMEQLFDSLDRVGRAGEKSSDKILKAGGKVFLTAMKQNLQNHRNGKLEGALNVSPVQTDTDGVRYVQIGTKLPSGKYRNKVFYAHLIEGGHIVKSHGKVSGNAPAHPFMLPAYVSRQKQVGDLMMDMLKKELQL